MNAQKKWFAVHWTQSTDAMIATRFEEDQSDRKHKREQVDVNRRGKKVEINENAELAIFENGGRP
jgi:hypothetical protein